MINSRKIEDLTPTAKEKCEKFIEECRKKGLNIKVIQTLRDAQYQNNLYQQGRTLPHTRKVTNCDGYKVKSAHQSGNAWDAVPVDEHGVILWDSTAKFKIMADIAKEMGIKPGYYFKMVDSPHFEI